MEILAKAIMGVSLGFELGSAEDEETGRNIDILIMDFLIIRVIVYVYR